MRAHLTKPSVSMTAISVITGKIKVVISAIEAGYITEATEHFPVLVGEDLVCV